MNRQINIWDAISEGPDALSETPILLSGPELHAFCEYARERAARERCERLAYPTHTLTLTHQGAFYQARAINSTGYETTMIAAVTPTEAYTNLAAALEARR